MTTRYLYLLGAALLLFLLAFSTGSPAFLAPAGLFSLLLLYAPVSVRLARRGMKMHLQFLQDRVRRGDQAELHITAAYRSLLPVSPIQLQISIGEDMPLQPLEIPCSAQAHSFSLLFSTRHAGVIRPKVNSCGIRDIFGIYAREYGSFRDLPELLVLPVDFRVEPLIYTQVDAGLGTMAKANEDITSPSDIRSYQTGDPMKKIHWKLSARKQELLVRKFDEPVLPDALVILNCEKPASPDIQDALLETALSVMKVESAREHGIRLPLLGTHPTEVEGQMGIGLIAENLARMEWTAGSSFEEVLLIESGRLRRFGATVIITSVLSGELVEIMCQMRRIGPALRLYLITVNPSDPDLMPFVSRLQQASCEVCYVSPAGTA